MTTKPSRKRDRETRSTFKQDVSNEDWEELRNLLFEEAREHDKGTAFGPENINLHKGLEFILYVYQCGREHCLPLEWKDAWNNMQFHRTPEWREYQNALAKLERISKRVKKHESVDLTNVVGEPVCAVLQGVFQQERSAPSNKNPRKRSRKPIAPQKRIGTVLGFKK